MIPLLFSLIIIASSAMPFKINPGNHTIVDEYGRTRIFHGVNVVYKYPPWYPETDTWNPITSFNEKDMAFLQSLGFNFVRLGTMWPGVSVAPGPVINSTYLSVLDSILTNMQKYGLYALLDVHQDLLTPFFCGEGAPDHIVEKFLSEYSGMEFPRPVHFEPLPKGPDGKPLLKDCLKTPFAKFELAEAFEELFQQVIHNSNGFRDDLVTTWKSIISYFKSRPSYNNIVGLELINEPFPCNIYKDPECLFESGKADLLQLQPFYDILANAIRSVDNSSVIFYESSLTDYVHKLPGFTHVPGGSAFTDRSVLSIHVYCLSAGKGNHPFITSICNSTEKAFFRHYYNSMLKTGGAAFMTEFGALPNYQDDIEMLDLLLDVADENRVSWAYWAYKSFNDPTTQTSGETESFYFNNGSLQQVKIDALARTYPQAIAGKLLSFNFERMTGEFSLNFIADKSIREPSIIFLYEKKYYPNGYDISFEPQGIVTVVQSPNFVHLLNNGNGSVSVTIVPKVV